MTTSNRDSIISYLDKQITSNGTDIYFDFLLSNKTYNSNINIAGTKLFEYMHQNKTLILASFFLTRSNNINFQYNRIEHFDEKCTYQTNNVMKYLFPMIPSKDKSKKMLEDDITDKLNDLQTKIHKFIQFVNGKQYEDSYTNAFFNLTYKIGSSFNHSQIPQSYEDTIIIFKENVLDPILSFVQLYYINLNFELSLNQSFKLDKALFEVSMSSKFNTTLLEISPDITMSCDGLPLIIFKILPNGVGGYFKSFFNGDSYNQKESRDYLGEEENIMKNLFSQMMSYCIASKARIFIISDHVTTLIIRLPLNMNIESIVHNLAKFSIKDSKNSKLLLKEIGIEYYIIDHEFENNGFSFKSLLLLLITQRIEELYDFNEATKAAILKTQFVEQENAMLDLLFDELKLKRNLTSLEPVERKNRLNDIKSTLKLLDQNNEEVEVHYKFNQELIRIPLKVSNFTEKVYSLVQIFKLQVINDESSGEILKIFDPTKMNKNAYPEDIQKEFYTDSTILNSETKFNHNDKSSSEKSSNVFYFRKRSEFISSQGLDDLAITLYEKENTIYKRLGCLQSIVVPKVIKKGVFVDENDDFKGDDNYRGPSLVLQYVGDSKPNYEDYNHYKLAKLGLLMIHLLNVVHRDIASRNIRFYENRVFFIDFGSSRISTKISVKSKKYDWLSLFNLFTNSKIDTEDDIFVEEITSDENNITKFESIEYCAKLINDIEEGKRREIATTQRNQTANAESSSEFKLDGYRKALENIELCLEDDDDF